MKLSTLIICLLLFNSFSLFGQVASIKGQIEENPVIKISIFLVDAKDSSIVKTTAVDTTFRYFIKNIPFGEYYLKATALGTKTYYSKNFILNDTSVFEIPRFSMLQDDPQLLDVVNVMRKKNQIEIRPGKAVINIDASPTNSGTNVIEVLRKSPGISLDQNGEISLNGRKGIQVLIDGNRLNLSGQELNNYLSNLQSVSIERIEFLTGGSSKIDASGGAGAINIITKKSKADGFNVTTNLNYLQGKYGKTNLGINANYRIKSTNVYFNGTSEYGTDYLRIPGPQFFYDNKGKEISSLDGATFSKTKFNSPTINIITGIDYEINSSNSIGFSATINSNKTLKIGNSKIRSIDHIQETDSLVEQYNTTSKDFISLATNFHYNGKLSEKTEISSNLDYLRYYPKQFLTFDTHTFSSENGMGYDRNQKAELPFLANIYSGRVDISNSINKDMKLDLGFKEAHVDNNNSSTYHTKNISNEWILNEIMSRKFSYSENISAAYSTLTLKVRDFEITGGLRIEHTRFNGKLLKPNLGIYSPDSSFSDKYTDLFPNFSITHSKNENTLSFSYAKRIDRPNYYDLNPFLYYVTPYTYITGNPNLKPQYSHNFELYYAVKSLLNVTLNYSIAHNYFENLSYLVNQTTTVKPTNVSDSRSLGMTINLRPSIKNWWKGTITLNPSYNRFEGTVNSQNLLVNNLQFSANLINDFTIPKGWNAELSGYYKSRSKYLQGTYYERWSANFAIVKKINERLSLKAGISDIFYSQALSGMDNLPLSQSYYTFYTDSRRFMLSMTYRLGRKSEIASRKNNQLPEAERVR